MRHFSRLENVNNEEFDRTIQNLIVKELDISRDYISKKLVSKQKYSNTHFLYLHLIYIPKYFNYNSKHVVSFLSLVILSYKYQNLKTKRQALIFIKSLMQIYLISLTPYILQYYNSLNNKHKVILKFFLVTNKIDKKYLLDHIYPKDQQIDYELKKKIPHNLINKLKDKNILERISYGRYDYKDRVMFYILKNELKIQSFDEQFKKFTNEVQLYARNTHYQYEHNVDVDRLFSI